MNATTHQHQPYCQQLLLDCDDSIFQGPLFRGENGGPTKKMRDLESPNSEDAVTWSVFRLLERHFADQPWLLELLALAGCELAASGTPQVNFWEKGYPTQSRLLWLLDHVDNPRVAESQGAGEDPSRLRIVRQNLAKYRQRVQAGQIRGKYKWVLEGPTEFDALIRCPGLLIAVETKLYSDVATEVRWDKERDQIARVVDVGREVARQEDDDFCFLLITDRRRHEPPKQYEQLMAHYRSDQSLVLPADRLGWVTWGEIYDWLDDRRARCTVEQIGWIDRLRSYLAQRSLLEGQI
ncbi:MAG: hypothetical protein E3J21_16710 [Anaerolineales bacterium]|nr:MAG: hypothetical protein E3J21_16710 [Anaerolineales bacterium]